MMKVLLILGFTLGVTSAVSNDQWNTFKQTYNKSYNVYEDKKRYAVFTENLAKIEKHNRLYDQGLTSYTMGLNQFADMTTEEFAANLKSCIPTPNNSIGVTTFDLSLISDLPKAVDWRDKGVVSEVKNQGETCGSCWAFSTTGSLESHAAIKTNKLISLSEQELVDCCSSNHGCGGGWPTIAFDYVQENGLTSEKEYPYEAHNGSCRRDSKPSAVNITGYVNILPSEKDLVAAVALKGPVSVVVDYSSWLLYHGGVFHRECSKTNPSHAVLVVGYNDLSEMPYWIVKNSWGKSWGEDGYIRLIRNKNICGIANWASYPIM